MGVISLLKLHLNKIAYKRNNWQYSIITLVGFFIMLFFGFIYIGIDVPRGAHLKAEGSAFYWMFNYIYLPLASSMFALLAFFVASASYRAFRIRNFEASLLLSAGVLVMIGAVPVGAYIPSWVFVYILTSLLFMFIAQLFKNRDILFIASSNSPLIVQQIHPFASSNMFSAGQLSSEHYFIISPSITLEPATFPIFEKNCMEKFRIPLSN